MYSSSLFKRKLGLVSLIVLASLTWTQEGFAMECGDGSTEGKGSPKAQRSRPAQSQTLSPLDEGNMSAIEKLNVLKEKARNSDTTAQNQILDFHLGGLYLPFLKPEDTGFLEWKTSDPTQKIQNICALNGKYAAYVIHHWNDLKKSFPHLYQSVQALAKQDDAMAQFNLGGLFQQTKKMVEALKYYTLAADKGLAPAQAKLATMYYNGEGITIQKKEHPLKPSSFLNPQRLKDLPTRNICLPSCITMDKERK